MNGIVTVLVTAHNAATTIHQPLAALLAQELPDGMSLDIVVVDDRSDDGTAELARAAGDSRLRVVRLSGPPRPGTSARQQALDAGRLTALGDVILLLDADAIPPAGWVRDMAAAAAKADLVAWPLAFRPASAGGRRAVVLAAMQTADVSFYYFFCRLLNRLGVASGVCFGAAGVRAEMLNRVENGFSCGGFTLTEDLALARAVRRHGGRIAFVSGEAVTVSGCPTWGGVVTRALRTSAGGGASFLAVVLASWVSSLPLLVGLAATQVIPWILPLARWGVGIVLLSFAAQRARVRLPFWVAASFDVAAFTAGVAVALIRVRQQEVRWGGVTYPLKHLGAARDGARL